MKRSSGFWRFPQCKCLSNQNFASGETAYADRPQNPVILPAAYCAAVLCRRRSAVQAPQCCAGAAVLCRRRSAVQAPQCCAGAAVLSNSQDIMNPPVCHRRKMSADSAKVKPIFQFFMAAQSNVLCRSQVKDALCVGHPQHEIAELLSWIYTKRASNPPIRQYKSAWLVSAASRVPAFVHEPPRMLCRILHSRSFRRPPRWASRTLHRSCGSFLALGMVGLVTALTLGRPDEVVVQNGHRGLALGMAVGPSQDILHDQPASLE